MGCCDWYNTFLTKCRSFSKMSAHSKCIEQRSHLKIWKWSLHWQCGGCWGLWWCSWCPPLSPQWTGCAPASVSVSTGRSLVMVSHPSHLYISLNVMKVLDIPLLYNDGRTFSIIFHAWSMIYVRIYIHEVYFPYSMKIVVII